MRIGRQWTWARVRRLSSLILHLSRWPCLACKYTRGEDGKDHENKTVKKGQRGGKDAGRSMYASVKDAISCNILQLAPRDGIDPLPFVFQGPPFFPTASPFFCGCLTAPSPDIISWPMGSRLIFVHLDSLSRFKGHNDE